MPPPRTNPGGAAAAAAGTFALVEDVERGGAVREVVKVRPGEPPLTVRFHPDVVARFVPVPDDQAGQVTPRWVYDPATGRFAPPPLAPAPAGPYYVPVSVVRERLEADGLWPAAAAALLGAPEIMLKVLTLRVGIASDDPVAIAWLQGIGADPARVLAPPGS